MNTTKDSIVAIRAEFDAMHARVVNRTPEQARAVVARIHARVAQAAEKVGNLRLASEAREELRKVTP